MDSLAAEFLSYRRRAAEDAGGYAGSTSRDAPGQQAEAEEGAAQVGIPFVRIDGSHDSAQVCAGCESVAPGPGKGRSPYRCPCTTAHVLVWQLPGHMVRIHMPMAMPMRPSCRLHALSVVTPCNASAPTRPSASPCCPSRPLPWASTSPRHQWLSLWSCRMRWAQRGTPVFQGLQVLHYKDNTNWGGAKVQYPGTFVEALAPRALDSSLLHCHSCAAPSLLCSHSHALMLFFSLHPLSLPRSPWSARQRTALTARAPPTPSTSTSCVPRTRATSAGRRLMMHPHEVKRRGGS